MCKIEITIKIVVIFLLIYVTILIRYGGMKKMKEQWKGFRGGNWCNRIDVKDFIQNNYKAYYKDSSFLEGITPEFCSCL